MKPLLAQPRSSTAWPGSTGAIGRLTLTLALLLAPPAQTQNASQLEHLGRGLVGLHARTGQVFLSWRLLATDPDPIAFNVYRAVEPSAPVRLNDTPIRDVCHFLDQQVNLQQPTLYSVRSVVAERETSTSAPVRFAANAPVRPYLTIPLHLPAGYAANDASVGNLDGDGEYELVLKAEERPRDTASTGLTGRTLLQGYRLDGTLLWTINLGRNIREGAHYTPFIVYDLDGDGVAEVACKTADGTMDGRGKTIGDPTADWRDTNSDSRTFGRVLHGPEYLTIFDGRTGGVLATTNYIPPRGDLGGWGGVGGNGGNDNLGNRVDRFLACVAYLDGSRPSLVMCRGYYGRSVLAAWDWRDRRLTSRWVFDSMDGNNPYSGQGGHQLAVADVDDDGRDEIIYHAMVVDDDGTGLYSTGLRHGDALHVGDLDPSRPGQEVFGVHENEAATVRLGTPGTALYEARTGKVLWTDGPGVDVGRGLTSDIDPRHPGEEMWSGPAGLRTCQGARLGPAPRTANFAIWWDGDLLRELLDRNRISKWRWETSTLEPLLTAEECVANNGTKATPCLSADLLGDWREEVLWRTPDNRELHLYTTTFPTHHRLVTLMHDRQYRLAVAWQNVGYNQPPHPSFYLGDGMKPPPRPSIVTRPPRQAR